jgi:hypothetical protein
MTIQEKLKREVRWLPKGVAGEIMGHGGTHAGEEEKASGLTFDEVTYPVRYFPAIEQRIRLTPFQH